MAKDEPRVQIEFEHSVESSDDSPAVVIESHSGGTWPLAIGALLLGGLLVGLLWLNAQAGESAADETAREEGGAGEDVADDAPELEEEPPETVSTIPESSNASITLEPTLLRGSAGVALFGDEVISLDFPGGANSATPPVVRSADGEMWDEIDTVVLVGGEVNTSEYSWSGLRSAGPGLAVSATNASGQRSSFVSANAVEWVQLPLEDEALGSPQLFEAFSVVDDAVIGLTLSSSDALAQFVEDHTTATDVADACFVGSRSVIGCDEVTEWPFTEATIDSVAGSEAVFSCLNLLSVVGPQLSLARVDLGEQSDASVLRIHPLDYFPQTLADGRVGGIDTQNFFDDQTACDGLATIDEVEADAFYLFNPADGAVDRAALSPEMSATSTEFLGRVEVETGERLLFQSGFQLWTLDLATSSWTLLNDVGGSRRLVVADSGRRLYRLDDSDLQIIDVVVDDDGEISLETATVYVPVPRSASLGFVWEATQDRVLVRAQGSEWLIDVPEDIRCIEQYADALAGNGLVDDC